jgi:hypothetical protein
VYWTNAGLGLVGGIMLVARKGEPIVCPNGHVGGSLDRDLADGEAIGSRDISIEDGGNHTLAGHVCLQCGERITEYRDGAFRVLTRQGWIGRLP